MDVEARFYTMDGTYLGAMVLRERDEDHPFSKGNLGWYGNTRVNLGGKDTQVSVNAVVRGTQDDTRAALAAQQKLQKEQEKAAKTEQLLHTLQENAAKAALAAKQPTSTPHGNAIAPANASGKVAQPPIKTYTLNDIMNAVQSIGTRVETLEKKGK